MSPVTDVADDSGRTDVLERPADPPEATRRYADGGTGVYEVWSPTGPTVHGVTVTLVHGGFWKAAYDRVHLRPLAGALARDGFHVASVEYPRVGMPGGAWPGTGAAVAQALRAVLADPALPHPVVAVGHSAGGHLVAWAGSDGRAGVGGTSGGGPGGVDGLVGVVPLAGVVDLELADRLHLGDDAVRGLLSAPATGVLPADRLAAADPARMRLVTPAVLVHGTDDETVPVAVARSYLDTRTADDAPARLVELPGVSHFELIDPEHPAYDTVVSAITSLLPH